MVAKRKISLVLADVDGTLVNEEKVLTKRAQSAVRQLRRAGIRFAITSGRPPPTSCWRAMGAPGGRWIERVSRRS